MNRWQRLLERAGVVLDQAFEVIANLLRVLIRGKFRPDGKSFRGGGYAEILPKEVLLQEVSLNAEDAVEARKIIALEPDRYLALDPAISVFDAAGPIEGVANVEGGSTVRRYVVGVTKKAILPAIRKDARAGFLALIEGFSFHPADYPDLVLVFRDERGTRLRRLRRAALAVAILALGWTAWDAFDAWRDRLAQRELAAQTEEATIQQHIHSAERRLAQARVVLAQLTTSTGPPLSKAVAALDHAARVIPADAEISKAAWLPASLTLEGRSYSPDNTELQLRRGFEGNNLNYIVAQGGQPATFKAEITFPVNALAPPPKSQ